MNKALGAYVASLVSSLVLMIAVTLLDVWVVYFILFKSGLLTELPLFWWFPLWIMEFTFPLCIILTFENRIPVICYLFFVFGGEDTLYYFLTVGHMPEKYIGIYFLGFIPSPARDVVLKSLALSMFLSLVICYVEYEKVKRQAKIIPDWFNTCHSWRRAYHAETQTYEAAEASLRL